MNTSPRRSSGAAAIFGSVVVVMWGLITHGTHAGSGDEPHYLVASYSAAFDGDFDLSNNYRDPGTLIGGPMGLEPEAHARRGRDGRLRPVHDIGMPLLFAPYVRVAHATARSLGRTVPSEWLARARLTESLLFRHLVSLAMIALTALVAVELFRALQDMGGAPRSAWWWALFVTLSPPFLSHAFLFFTEIPSALIVLFVFRRLQRGTLTRAEAVACAVGVGVLPLIHVRNIPLAAALAATAVVRRRTLGPSQVAPMAVAMLAGLAVRAVVTWRFWGTLVTTPHARPGEWSGAAASAHETATRLLGWAWDREYGLFAYAPIYLLAVPGLLLMARRNSRALWGVVAVAGVYLAAIALPLVNVHGWTGGWSPAGRFLVPIAPLLALAAFAAWRGGSPLEWVIVVAQVLLSAVVWQRPKLLWNDGDGVSALCDVPAPQCVALPSMVLAGAADWLGAAAWSAAAALLAWWTVRRAAPASTR